MTKPLLKGQPLRDNFCDGLTNFVMQARRLLDEISLKSKEGLDPNSHILKTFSKAAILIGIGALLLLLMAEIMR